MRKILKIASAILLGVILLMNVGCARKGSRVWVEDQISDLEKVYPTENAEDLFQKFPNGFRVSQTGLFQELELNKNVFKKLEDKGGTFSYETNKYEIVYEINNGKINNYLGFSNEEVSMEVIGQYSENDKTYFHTLVINDKDKKLYFFEKVVEDKENAEDDTE